jgi:hypothetical protein
MTQATDQFDAIRIRSDAKRRLREFSLKRRMKLVEAASVAVDALLSLPADSQNALIERRSESIPGEASPNESPTPSMAHDQPSGK